MSYKKFVLNKMVLEEVSPQRAEKRPKDMFYLGFIYSTLGLLFALMIFGDIASYAGIFFTTLPVIIVLYNAVKIEEQKDDIVYRNAELIRGAGRELHTNRFLIREHGRVVSFLLYVFLGIAVSYALWYTILPERLIGTAFDLQVETINEVGSGVGSATGHIVFREAFVPLFTHNLRVLIFCILFSFVYGAGAVFILIWNASIVGVTIGNLLRKSILEYSGTFNSNFLISYFKFYPVSIGYMIHGIPEVMSYLLGTLAGGIISVAVVNHKFSDKEFKHIVVDSLDLVVLSVVTLFCAGLIEVYVTPVIF